MLVRLFTVTVLALVTLLSVPVSAAEVSLDKTEQGYAVMESVLAPVLKAHKA